MVRLKNRYFVIEVRHPNRHTYKSLGIKTTPLHISIMTMVQQVHGDFGAAATSSGFSAKYCNDKTNIAVIKCRRGPHRIIASALPLIKSIDLKDAVVNTIYMGATIKKCFKFIQKHQQQQFDRYCASISSEAEKEEMRKALISVEDVMKMM